MSAISIEKLYVNYEILTEAKNKIGEHTKEYEEIIAGVKGGEKEKKLAPQFIAKFFKHFPTLHYQAIEALFDICEDDDMSIRKQAIKVLPSLCKDTKEHTSKVSDVLAQLLQLDDPQEHTIATNSLLEVTKVDAMQSLKGILKQMVSGEYVVREKCVKFITTKLHTLGSDIVTKEVEDFIFTEIKKIILETSAEDFISLMQYLTTVSSYSRTPAGQQEIMDIAVEQAQLDDPFQPLDKDNDNVDRLIICMNYILPYVNAKTDIFKFITYYCDQVLPQFNVVGEMERGQYFQLTILKQLAELCSHCGNPPTTSSKQIEGIYNLLKTYLPPPPETNEMTEIPQHDYSAVECLLYAFHKLARHNPEFLTSNPDQLKDFRIRLQYFARGIQGCIKSIKENASEIKKDDEKLKKNALKVITNINTLIKDLFYTPPSYKSAVCLSWKQDDVPRKTQDVQKQQIAGTGTGGVGKRHAPITIDFDKNIPPHKATRKSSDNVKIYTPPSGKFSNNFQNRKPLRGRGGGGGGRGGGLGRGRGRGRGNWRN